MIQENHFLERIIDYIEEHITEQLTLKKLSDEFHISEVYLKKMFRALFHMPISTYIRKRKLSLSTQELLKTNYRIIDIALYYGFKHVQTYINAFKDEFEITPYQWKRKGNELHYTKKISFQLIREVNKGVIIPECIIMPSIYLNGTQHHFTFEESHKKAPEAALSFWCNQYPKMKNVVEKGVYYGVTDQYNSIKKTSDYYCMAHVSQKNHDCHEITIPSSRYFKFVYIGQHSYESLSIETAQTMYQAIYEFFESELGLNYNHENNHYFERVDTNQCTNDFCVMEWYFCI